MDRLSFDTIKIIFKYAPNECKQVNKMFYSCSSSIRIGTEYMNSITDDILLSLPIHKFYSLMMHAFSDITDDSVKRLTNLMTIECNENITSEGIKDLIHLRYIICNGAKIDDTAFENLSKLKFLDLRDPFVRLHNRSGIRNNNNISKDMKDKLKKRKVKIIMFKDNLLDLY